MWPLPNDSVGVSDLLGWRECPARFELQMRRHTEGEIPGELDWTTAYGSAIHDCIHLIETEGLTNEQAVERVWPKYATLLGPEELALLKEDMNTYRGDVPLGYELVSAEQDGRVPMFVHRGVQVYFRFKIDALYRRVDDHTSFLSRDYKSSRHPKSQKEVDEDIQQWAYNYGIHELYPECRTLLQSYEQLRFGVKKTSKNAEQRKQMRDWLEATMRAMIADTTHPPKQNDYCAYCPLVATCDQTVRATRAWRGKLAVLAPQTKEGRKTKIKLLDEGDDFEAMIREELPKIIQTRKHLEAAEKAIKEVIEAMPNEEREALGWRLADRKTKVTDPEGLRMIHDALGDSFYEVISLVKSNVEAVLGKPTRGEPLTPQLKLLKDVELESVGSTMLVPTRK